MNVRSPGLFSTSKWGKITLCITCIVNNDRASGIEFNTFVLEDCKALPLPPLISPPIMPSQTIPFHRSLALSACHICLSSSIVSHRSEGGGKRVTGVYDLPLQGGVDGAHEQLEPRLVEIAGEVFLFRDQ